MTTPATVPHALIPPAAIPHPPPRPAQAVRAEFRKILSLRTWWALAAALVLPVGALTWMTTLLLWAVDEVGDLGHAATAVLGFARGVNLGAVFAMVFGVLAVSGEHRARTIGTSVLTTGRTRLLTAKLAAYGVLGLVFGVVVTASATAGALAAGADTFPSPGRWVTLCAMGVLSMVLWTLLGVGLGALITTPWVVVSFAVVYTLIIETQVINRLLVAGGLGGWAAFLPNTSGDGMLSDLAAVLFLAEANEHGGVIGPDVNLILAAAGGSSTVISETIHTVASWQTSTVVFLAWTAAFVAAGWWCLTRRDLRA